MAEDFVIPNSLYSQFKMDDILAVFCRKGELNVSVNMRRYSAKAPCMLLAVCDQPFQLHHTATSPQVTCMLLSRDFTDQFMADLAKTGPLYQSALEHPLVQFNEQEVVSAMLYLSLIKRTLNRLDNPFRLDSVKHLCTSFFLDVILALRNSEHLAPSSRANEIMFDFLDLLTQNFRQERGIKFYSDQLYLTDKYLSRVVREVSGRTVHDWIDEYVGTEAQTLLRCTSKSVNAIAEELNFSSASLFSKYFKRIFGLTPQDFRRNLS